MADDRNSLSNEIGRLHRLREDGALTDAEFIEAKRRLITSVGRGEGESRDGDDQGSSDLGRAANRYVTHEKNRSVVGLIVFVALILFVFIPFACYVSGQMRDSDRGFGDGLPPHLRNLQP